MKRDKPAIGAMVVVVVGTASTKPELMLINDDDQTCEKLPAYERGGGCIKR